METTAKEMQYGISLCFEVIVYDRPVR